MTVNGEGSYSNGVTKGGGIIDTFRYCWNKPGQWTRKTCMSFGITVAVLVILLIVMFVFKRRGSFTNKIKQIKEQMAFDNARGIASPLLKPPGGECTPEELGRLQDKKDVWESSHPGKKWLSNAKRIAPDMKRYLDCKHHAYLQMTGVMSGVMKNDVYRRVGLENGLLVPSVPVNRTNYRSAAESEAAARNNVFTNSNSGSNRPSATDLRQIFQNSAVVTKARGAAELMLKQQGLPVTPEAIDQAVIRDGLATRVVGPNGRSVLKPTAKAKLLGGNQAPPPIVVAPPQSPPPQFENTLPVGSTGLARQSSTGLPNDMMDTTLGVGTNIVPINPGLQNMVYNMFPEWKEPQVQELIYGTQR